MLYAKFEKKENACMLRFLRGIGNNPKRRMITFDTMKTISVSKLNDEENPSIYAFKQYDNVADEDCVDINFVSGLNEESCVNNDCFTYLNGDFDCGNGLCFNEKLHCKNDNAAKSRCSKNAPFSISIAYSKGKIVLRKQINIPLLKAILIASFAVASIILLPKLLPDKSKHANTK